MAKVMELSLVAQYDELRRSFEVFRDGAAEVEFLRFVQLQDECRMQWLKSIEEAKRLQHELDNALRIITNLESKLFHARKLLETETKARRHAEHERDSMERKMMAVCEIVRNEQTIRDETREQLAVFATEPRRRSRHGHAVDGGADRELGGVDNDINSTGSFLVDLSLTQSEDDFLEPLKMQAKRKSWKKHRPSYNNNTSVKVPQEPPKRVMEINSTSHIMEPRTEGEIIAHAKITVPTGPDGGPIQAESTFRTMAPQNRLPPAVVSSCASSNSTAATIVNVAPTTPAQEKQEPKKTVIQRQHDLVGRTFISSDTCNQCQERIRFGSSGLRCRECKALFHGYCREKISFPCVPQSQTKNVRRGTASTATAANNGGPATPQASGAINCLEDYCPSSSPRIPALIVHCVSEIENRGLTEVGLYRMSGSEREVRALKEKFLRGKTIPTLGQIDVHVLCSCIKDFLRTLREPLIPCALLGEFSSAVTGSSSPNSDHRTREQLCQLIERLPAPNRDTLAFLMLHFQRVALSEQAKMPIDNLARVFAPTIVGYSRIDLDMNAMCAETYVQFSIVQAMLQIHTDYWSQFILLQPASGCYGEESGKKGTAPTPGRRGGVGELMTQALEKERRMETPILRRPRKDRKYYATPPYKTSKD
ncbi:rac GTPase-activating protein 1 [Anopheles maculipalpis]|uniref:rac GTPase-activating protein 1 n=1 Tax=Anopheles maculipalpis TaxID=1496333 RepID=UPI0021591C4F|nr:rac GTPase-activating protein 1 [Anopheles maculipalpis]